MNDIWANEYSDIPPIQDAIQPAAAPRHDRRIDTRNGARLSSHRVRQIAIARESIGTKNSASKAQTIKLPKIPKSVGAKILQAHDAAAFQLGNYIKRVLGRNESMGQSDPTDSTTTKMQRLWDWCMTKRLSGSLAIAADWVDCTIEELNRFSRRLSGLILHHDFSCRRQVKWNVSSATHRKRLIMCDNNTEEETPMALAVLQRLNAPPELIRQAACDGVDSLVVQNAEQPKRSAVKDKSKTMAKLVQSENGHSFLTCDQNLQDFNSYRGTQISWIQLVESTNAEQAMQCERVRSGRTSVSKDFEI